MALNLNGTTGLTFNNGSTQDVGGVGIGQTWQDVSASRASGVTYTNTTGKPIMVNIMETTNATAEFYVNGVLVGRGVGTGTDGTISAIVPNGSNYNASLPGGFAAWAELR
jgi:hypothetical protein